MPATTNPEPAAIHPDRYREVMRHHPTGVAAVSSLDPDTGKPCGLVVGTLASLSLDPALITFSVGRTSSSWPKIARTGKFTVSLLAQGQQAVAAALSGRKEDKFAGLAWSLSALGTPRIDGAVGWIDCTVERELDGGDHVLVIATVVGLSASGGEPMVFHGGSLGGFRRPEAV